MTHDIVRLMGGLGNQMFQHAFARHLARASGRVVKLDTRNGFTRDDRGRTLALGAFRGSLPAAERREIPIGMSWSSPWHRVARTAWSVMPQSLASVVYERRQFAVDGSLARPAQPRYYFGYWQHPGYFESIQDEIREDFQLREELTGAVGDLAREMASSPSVSVHVRSYLDVGLDGRVIPEAQTHHGTCSSEFYRKAVETAADGIEATCYVFADNVEWARERLKLPLPCRYVADLVRCSDVEEMMLMASCRHHVISNSTFSWWGAWLGRNPGKRVVAPRVWVRALPEESVKICPEGWVRL